MSSGPLDCVTHMSWLCVATSADRPTPGLTLSAVNSIAVLESYNRGYYGQG